jgi:hypothetical protein
MQLARNVKRLAIFPTLAAVLLVAGCQDSNPNLDPEGGEKLKQARISAYGKAGYASAKGASTVSVGGAQGAARAAAKRGGR